jgi:hypothetical protein
MIETLGAWLRALFGAQGRFIGELPVDRAEAFIEEANHEETPRRAA